MSHGRSVHSNSHFSCGFRCYCHPVHRSCSPSHHLILPPDGVNPPRRLPSDTSRRRHQLEQAGESDPLSTSPHAAPERDRESPRMTSAPAASHSASRCLRSPSLRRWPLHCLLPAAHQFRYILAIQATVSPPPSRRRALQSRFRLLYCTLPTLQPADDNSLVLDPPFPVHHSPKPCAPSKYTYTTAKAKEATLPSAGVRTLPQQRSCARRIGGPPPYRSKRRRAGQDKLCRSLASSSLAR